MEKDLDKKLYNDYLDGQKEAFEFLPAFTITDK